MMTAKPITPTLSVSEQVQPQDMDGLAAAGFRAVICNRPDGEGADQPTFAEIEAAAKAAGMEAAYLPITPGQAGPHEAQAFRDLMDRLPKPILAFCRSGNRSASLWSMAQSVRV
jgi:sulfide:quinone oxidoreductase